MRSPFFNVLSHPAFATTSAAVLVCLVLLPLLRKIPDSPLLAEQPVQSQPITLLITKPGVYSGVWSSGRADIPVVRVRTPGPVVIENSSLTGPGDLIRAEVDRANITVRNCRGTGLNPNVAGRIPGRFFTGGKCARVLIENNEFSHTSGIDLLNYQGDFKPDNTFKIIRNIANNIDGRKSDGHGGWLDFNARVPLDGGKTELGHEDVHFVILDKVRGLPGVEIAWNQVINQPADSRVEDVINIYLSSGTQGSPIQIHDNFIHGAYNIRPWERDSADANYRYDWQYSGGGILLGDGNPDSPDHAPGWVDAFHNQVINTSNYGIAISAGHNLCFHDNRILSSGRLPDGRPIPTQNVGAYIWDIHKGTGNTPRTFFDNSAHDNLVGWAKETGRNDTWTPHESTITRTTHYPNPITAETEQVESTLWKEKLEKAGVILGIEPPGKVR